MANHKSTRSIHLTQHSTQTNTTQPNAAQSNSAQPNTETSLPQPGPAQASTTQPNPEPAEVMPVRAHVYRTLAEMNLALEQAIQGLETLVKISYFSSESLRGTLRQLTRTRAQANSELISVLIERESANARYFQQLCRGPEIVR